MKNEAINKTVLLTLVFLISIIFLLMIKNFLMPIFMAALFSALASPVHRWLTTKLKGREVLASAITVFGIVVLVLGPLSALITVVAAQAFTSARR